uniref:Uncharacterized protein n=1 Tax=Arundo donax TaxID=35708 RepID=A0A0A9HNA7_ARUDO
MLFVLTIEQNDSLVGVNGKFFTIVIELNQRLCLF